jgi:hypothetical protein
MRTNGDGGELRMTGAELIARERERQVQDEGIYGGW